MDTGSPHRRPGKIPVIASIALAALSFYAAAGNYAFSGFSLFVFLYIVFGFAFVALGFAMRTGRPVALIASVVASLVFMVLSLPVGLLFLSEPTAFPPFIFAVMAFPVGLLSLVSSALSWADLRKSVSAPALAAGRSRVSSLLAFSVIGFVVGSLLIGGLAAARETTLLASSGTTADVTIVLGAATQGNPLPYSPSPYTVKVGSTVTWVNKDGGTHTVTSVGSALFDSGDMPPGGTFKFTFTQPGTYQYYCTIHPWMTGTIVVTTG
jgi:plastocyanin